MLVKNRKAILGFGLVVPRRDLAAARLVARVKRERSESSWERGMGGEEWWVVGTSDGAKRKRMSVKEMKRVSVGMSGVGVDDNILFFGVYFGV